MDNIKYSMSKDMKKEWSELAKKVNREMVNEVTMEIFNKLIDIDFNKIVGFELTKGQNLIMLIATSDRLSKSINSMLIKHYNIIGKDNKKNRKEFKDFLNSIFIQGLMNDMKD